MKISVNWLKWCGLENPAPEGIDALVERIGAQLGAIEEVVNLGDKYKGVLVARVVSCEGHPDADRLHVCKLDDGGVAKNVERDENGYVQVVCGAPNVREGLLVAWLPPGAAVPESIEAGDPFVLEARALRGVVSNGMLASPRELAIGESHEGILEIDSDEAKPGMALADVYELNDTIIDVENKMFTHRPDCFGQLGVAREIAGIYGQSFYSPDWYLHVLTDELGQDGPTLPLTVRNELPQEVPRFMAAALSGVQVKPSPVWLQSYLARVGVRPINNVVDITNYIMLLTGQPLHAYDYDKVLAQDAGAQTASLVVRYPREGEKITLLNGKEITPRSQAMMIATENKLIGVGGVMGGADTEVDENTKNIILECATFDMYSIRRTSMAHGLFTDAVTRNNKGQSPLQNDRVLAKTVQMLRQLAEAHVAAPIADSNHLDAVTRDRDAMHAAVKVSRQFINSRLGFDLTVQAMATLLTNVEFTVQLDGDDLIVTAPFWRTDIEIPEDIVEEVGRLYGFDHLPKVLPKRDLTPAAKSHMFELKKRIRNILSSAGASEVLSYSFVHSNLLQKAGQDPARAFQLANASSPDVQYYRLSLTPSLLDKVHQNVKAGYDQFALFEMGMSHNNTVFENMLPAESARLSFVYAAKNDGPDAAYYMAHYYLQYVLPQIHDCYDIVSWHGLSEYAQNALAGKNTELLDYAALAAPYEMARTGFVLDKSDPQGLPVAIAGEFRRTVVKAFKLPEKCAGFEILLNHVTPPVRPLYQAKSRFPKVEQDICLKVDADRTYGDVFNFMQAKFADIEPENTAWELSPIDIYQRQDDLKHKQITLRLSIASFDKTLTDAEVARMLDQVADAAAQGLGAQRI